MTASQFASLIADLANAGGLALFLGMCIVVALGAVRRWWVPGWIYEKELARNETLSGQLERHGESIRTLTAVVQQAVANDLRIERRSHARSAD